MRTTAQSDVGKLRKLIVKHVRDAFVDDATIDGQWQRLNYYGRPDLPRAVNEYDRFVKLLEGLGAEIEFLPPDSSVTMDSLAHSFESSASTPTSSVAMLSRSLSSGSSKASVCSSGRCLRTAIAK